MTPSGHDTIIMPTQMFFIENLEAVWEGDDFGVSVHLAENPTIGGIPMPTCPLFAIGQAHMRIRDRQEYLQTRKRVDAETRKRNRALQPS